MGQTQNALVGEVNGVECQIIPNTGAEVTIVPGNLVYACQLLDEYDTIRSVAGGPGRAQRAVIPIKFEGKEYTHKVVMANKELLNDSVLFAVPLKEKTARQLFLDAAVEADTSGAGQSGDAPDIQSGANTEVNFPLSSKVAKTSHSGDKRQCQAVTRMASQRQLESRLEAETRTRQQVILSPVTESEQVSAVVDSSPSASQPMEIEWLKSGRAAPKVGGASADSKAASLSDLVLDEMEATPTEGVASKTTPPEGGVVTWRRPRLLRETGSQPVGHRLLRKAVLRD